MYWWLWIIVGLVLLALEMVVPGGLVLLFFGFGAIATGVLAGIGLADADWLQWLIFAVISAVLLITLRKKVAHSKFFRGKSATVDTFVGESCVCLENVPASGVGRVELRGSTWSAKSATGQAIAKGTRCKVESVDHLTLIVKSE